MLILSLDPGGTTGVALIESQEDTEPQLLWATQVNGGLAGFMDFYLNEIKQFPLDLIVCESFTLREGIYGADLSPVYIIGALEAFNRASKVEIKYQAPSQKSLCDDARLKKMGLHQRGKQHANDAIRHAIIYLRNSLHKPTLKLGWQ